MIPTELIKKNKQNRHISANKPWICGKTDKNSKKNTKKTGTATVNLESIFNYTNAKLQKLPCC